MLLGSALESWPWRRCWSPPRSGHPAAAILRTGPATREAGVNGRLIGQLADATLADDPRGDRRLAARLGAS